MERNFLKHLIRKAAKSDRAWRLMDRTLLAAARYAENVRRHEIANTAAAWRAETLDRAIKRLCPDLTVKGGPFRGLRYPTADAAGSVLVPKLLGTYEFELHDTFEEICRAEIGWIADIGCAEGYYAVGLAIRMPLARVFAFDIDDRAVDLCQRMARFNGVSERLCVGKGCDSETLRRLADTGPGLVISDCEGAEATLFDSACVEALAESRVVIETHDFLVPGVTSTLAIRFSGSHDVRTTASVPDEKRHRVWPSENLTEFDEPERVALMAERRPGQMFWLVATPRGHAERT